MAVASSLLWVMGGCHTPVVVVYLEEKPHTPENEPALLLAFRHFSMWLYLARLMPLVAEGKFAVLAGSKYIAGEILQHDEEHHTRN